MSRLTRSRLRPSSRRSLAAASAAAVMTLVACGGSGGGPAEVPAADGPYEPPASDIEATLTISNWGDPVDQEVYEEVAARFKERYPNVTVKNNFTPITTWSDYVNKLTAQVAGGDAPDVINIAIEGFQLGLDKNLFASLEGYLENDPDGQKLTEDVDPRLLETFEDSGSTYLIPSTWNTMLIYYNTKMFEDAGIERPSDDWTWDDFLAIAEQLTTGEGSDKVYGFALPYFNFGLTPWLYSSGTSEMSDDLETAQLDDPKVVEAMTWVRDLVTEHGVAPQPKGADPYQLFPAGKVAMTGAGHWTVPMFADAGFEDYDVLPWPSNGTTSTVFGGSGFGIYPQTDNPDLAWEYIKELTNATTQAKWAEIGSATPATHSAAQSPDFTAKPEHSDLYYDAIEYAEPVAAPTVFNTLEPAFMRAMDAIMAGGDPAEELGKAQDEVQDALDSE